MRQERGLLSGSCVRQMLCSRQIASAGIAIGQTSREVRVRNLLLWVAVTGLLSSAGCGGDSSDSRGIARLDAQFLLITPYVSESDVIIKTGFSSQHDGTDFLPKSDNTAFRAVCDGEVTDLILMKDANPNSGGSPFQVIVRVKYNNTFYIEYNFETKSESDAAGADQLAAIPVSVGQTIAQGDIVGRLRVPTAMLVGQPHVHWSVEVSNPNDQTVVVRDESTGQDVSVLMHGGVWPAPYFINEARTSFLSLYAAAGQPVYP